MRPQAVQPRPQPRKNRSGWKVMLSLLGVMLLGGSLLMNLVLLVLLSGSLGDGAELKQEVIHKGDSGQTIAVYTLAGVVDGKMAEHFADFFDAVRQDEDVKAVVLRVESPGGGITASDQIYSMVHRLRHDHGKTVVVSMGGVAASGGYYLSAPAHEIVAEPTTLTGSIGVIATWPVIEGTLEKIGVDMMVMKSDNARGWKDDISPFRHPSRREREGIQEMLNKMQERFEQVVREGRGPRLNTEQQTYTMTVGEGEAAREVRHTETVPFNGRVYLANAAKARGLIDEIGYETAAFDRAAALAGLGDPHIVRYARKVGFWEAVSQQKAHTMIPLDVQTIDELQTPRLMMMWKVQ